MPTPLATQEPEPLPAFEAVPRGLGAGIRTQEISLFDFNLNARARTLPRRRVEGTCMTSPIHRQSPFFVASISIEPHAKERPRVGRGRMYTPTATVQYERELAKAYRREVPVLNDADDLCAVFRFYSSGLKRKDTDNCIKSALDAGNKVLFRDDSQVVTVMAEILYGSDDPRVELELSVWRPASEIPTAPRGNARSKRKPKRALPIPTGFEACGCGTGIRPVGLAQCRRCSQQHAVAK